MGTLVSEFGQVRLQAEDQSEAFASTRALEVVAQAVSESQEVLLPTLGTSNSNTLRLRMVDTRDPTRLQWNWRFDPIQPEVTVTYRLQGSELLRDITVGTNPAETTVVARKLAGFSASHLRSTSVVLRLTTQERDLLRTRELEAYRWVR